MDLWLALIEGGAALLVAVLVAIYFDNFVERGDIITKHDKPDD